MYITYTGIIYRHFDSISERIKLKVVQRENTKFANSAPFNYFS